MRMPHVNLSPVTLTDTFGFYLLIRLQAIAELAYILEYFTGVRTAILNANEAYRNAVMARRAAVALRDHQNDRMDQEIRVLAFTILGVVSNNRSSPLFRHYFPQGFSEVLRTPVLQQRRRAVVLLEKLEAERDEVVRARLEPFRTGIQELEASLDALEEARDEEARQRSNREAAKIAWLDGYRRTYQMLQDHYAADPRKAEEFFRAARASSSSADEEDELDFEADLEEAGDIAEDQELDVDARVGDPDFDEQIAGLPPIRTSGVLQVAERPTGTGDQPGSAESSGAVS